MSTVLLSGYTMIDSKITKYFRKVLLSKYMYTKLLFL